MSDITSTGAAHMAAAEQTITRLLTEPDHDWHIKRNADSGAAAIDFIRYAKVRNFISQYGGQAAIDEFGRDLVQAAMLPRH